MISSRKNCVYVYNLFLYVYDLGIPITFYISIRVAPRPQDSMFSMLPFMIPDKNTTYLIVSYGKT